MVLCNILSPTLQFLQLQSFQSLIQSEKKTQQEAHATGCSHLARGQRQGLCRVSAEVNNSHHFRTQKRNVCSRMLRNCWAIMRSARLDNSLGRMFNENLDHLLTNSLDLSVELQQAWAHNVEVCKDMQPISGCEQVAQRELQS